jgi:hypothetical protein
LANGIAEFESGVTLISAASLPAGRLSELRESMVTINTATPAAKRQQRCAVCGAQAAVQECHFNRYREGICRPCRVAGKRWSRRRQVQRLVTRAFGYSLAISGAALLFYYSFSWLADRLAH